MAIENLECSSEKSMVIQNNFVTSSNVIVAGSLKVKHPLIEPELLVVGFVADDRALNATNFQVSGTNIRYRTLNLRNEPMGTYNDLVYTKVLIDNKEDTFDNLFEIESIKCRGYRDYNYHDWMNFDSSDKDIQKKFNYYLFENWNARKPECAANTVFVICKYIDNGLFKYALFGFNEIVPVLP